MNKKQKFINILTAIEVITMIVASIAVLFFRFLPYYECLFTAFIGYAIGFFATAFRSLFECINIFRAAKQEPLNEENNNDKKIKNKEKTKAVVKTVLWFIMWIFAMVVLILYPRPL